MGVLADEVADILDLGVERFGVAGAVGEEDAVGLERENIFGGGERRDHGDAAAGVDEAAQDVVLDAEIISDDVIAGFAAAADEVGGGAGLDGCGPFVAVRRW